VLRPSGSGRAWRFLPALALAVLAPVAQAAWPDSALKAFLAKFADMAAHGAADSMAKVTRFPLRNRVYQAPERISAAGFKHHFELNRFRELAGCLKSTPPRRADSGSADLGEWIVECDGNNFYFAQDGGGWRFSGFENVNE
jgi:hypothetical protein